MTSALHFLAVLVGCGAFLLAGVCFELARITNQKYDPRRTVWFLFLMTVNMISGAICFLTLLS